MGLAGLRQKELEDGARSVLCLPRRRRVFRLLSSLFPQIGLFYLFVFKQFR